LRLPPTALGSGFDLLALRARCKRELRGYGASVQEGRTEVFRNLHQIPFGPCKTALSAVRSKGPDQKFTEPVALSSTSPVNLRLPPTALGSGFDLLALRARCTGEDRASRHGRARPCGCDFGAFCAHPAACAPVRNSPVDPRPVWWLPPSQMCDEPCSTPWTGAIGPGGSRRDESRAERQQECAPPRGSGRSLAT